MAHYFENDGDLEERPSSYSFELAGHTFHMESSSGVFSTEKLDTGTRILLETVLEYQNPVPSLLDLGCGIGVVGVVLGTIWHCSPDLIDVNERACRLAERNLQAAGLQGTVRCQDGITGGEYDCILLNPPIRAGKETIFRLYRQALGHLKAGGSLWIVIRRQHGAASTVRYLEEQGAHVERRNRDKGYWVLQVNRLD